MIIQERYSSRFFALIPPFDSSDVFIGYSIGQNAILKFYLNFYICFCAFWHFDIAPETHYHKEETIETHREIADAIAAHDPLRAQDAMYLHLVYNRKRIQMIGK